MYVAEIDRHSRGDGSAHDRAAHITSLVITRSREYKRGVMASFTHNILGCRNQPGCDPVDLST